MPEALLAANEADFFPAIATIGGQPAETAMPGAAFSGDVIVAWQNPAITEIVPW